MTPESTEPRTADATAELARYADKYRDTRIDEQFDLLLIYAKSLAAETQNTSLTNSEIEWLYRSVRNALLATIAPTEPGRVVISVEAADIARSVLDGKREFSHIERAWQEINDAIAAERAATGGA